MKVKEVISSKNTPILRFQQRHKRQITSQKIKVLPKHFRFVEQFFTVSEISFMYETPSGLKELHANDSSLCLNF